MAAAAVTHWVLVGYHKEECWHSLEDLNETGCLAGEMERPLIIFNPIWYLYHAKSLTYP